MASQMSDKIGLYRSYLMHMMSDTGLLYTSYALELAKSRMAELHMGSYENCECGGTVPAGFRGRDWVR